MSQSSPSMIRILLVDSQALVRTGLRSFLQTRPDFLLVGDVGDAVDAITIAAQCQPDIILYEPNSSDRSALDLVSHLFTAAPSAKIILVTSIKDSEFYSRAARLGVMGAVSKDQAGEVLVKAIHKVHEGEAWLTRTTMGTVLAGLGRANQAPAPNPEAARINLLTPREREIISLIGEGLKNKQIAEKLIISEVTVRHNIATILTKLYMTDRLELLVFAYRNGLAQLPR